MLSENWSEFFDSEKESFINAKNALFSYHSFINESKVINPNGVQLQGDVYRFLNKKSARL